MLMHIVPMLSCGTVFVSNSNYCYHCSMSCLAAKTGIIVAAHDVRESNASVAVRQYYCKATATAAFDGYAAEVNVSVRSES